MAAPPTGKLQCAVCRVDTNVSTALICPSCQEANTNITKWFAPLPNWISSTQNNIVPGPPGTSQQQSKNPTTTNEGFRPPATQQVMSTQGYRSSFLGRTIEGSGTLSSNDPPPSDINGLVPILGKTSHRKAALNKQARAFGSRGPEIPCPGPPPQSQAK